MVFLPPDVMYGCSPYIYFDARESAAGLLLAVVQAEHLWFSPVLRLDFVLYSMCTEPSFCVLTDLDRRLRIPRCSASPFLGISILPGNNGERGRFCMWRLCLFTWAHLLSPSGLQLLSPRSPSDVLLFPQNMECPPSSPSSGAEFNFQSARNVVWLKKRSANNISNKSSLRPVRVS